MRVAAGFGAGVCARTAGAASAVAAAAANPDARNFRRGRQQPQENSAMMVPP